MNDMAKREMGAGGNKFAFGVDNDAVAAKLQQIADDIRGGRVLPQAVSIGTKNAQDDFEMVTLKLTYAEPRAGVLNLKEPAGE